MYELLKCNLIWEWKKINMAIIVAKNISCTTSCNKKKKIISMPTDNDEKWSSAKIIPSMRKFLMIKLPNL